MIIWALFLFRVSRLDLHLVPTHLRIRPADWSFSKPKAAFALTPVLRAQGFLVAGVLADRILFGGFGFLQFRFEILGVVIFLMSQALAPMLVFVPRIMDCRRKGIMRYGKLASDYVGDFENKWVTGGAEAREVLLGSGDIQSLADLANSFENHLEHERPTVRKTGGNQTCRGDPSADRAACAHDGAPERTD